MTVSKRELLTVRAEDDDPKSIINALLQLPHDVHLTGSELSDTRRNFAGHRFQTAPVTFTFEREVTDG